MTINDEDELAEIYTAQRPQVSDLRTKPFSRPLILCE